MLDDYGFLKQALALAATRRGYCAPNPSVGALIVKDGAVLAEGVHYACGMPHAEAAALKTLDFRAPGATLYVTLEPCCHYGRTPPCTKAIIEAGIKRVVYGYKDPNPLVAGKGHQLLVDAAIETSYIATPEIDAFYKSYAYWQKNRRPWVTAKLAMSFDGKTAGPEGARIAITGPELKMRTYAARQKSDALLTTSNTIIHDNPVLDIRLETGSENRALYILDRTLKVTSEYQIWNNTKKRTVFYSSLHNIQPSKKLLEDGVIFVPIPEQDERLDLALILDYIGQDGVHDLWVEAGGKLVESLLAQGLVHDLELYCAPKWLGEKSQSAFSFPLDFEKFTEKKWQQVGDDVVCSMKSLLQK